MKEISTLTDEQKTAAKKTFLDRVHKELALHGLSSALIHKYGLSGQDGKGLEGLPRSEADAIRAKAHSSLVRALRDVEPELKVISAPHGAVVYWVDPDKGRVKDPAFVAMIIAQKTRHYALIDSYGADPVELLVDRLTAYGVTKEDAEEYAKRRIVRRADGTVAVTDDRGDAILASHDTNGEAVIADAARRIVGELAERERSTEAEKRKAEQQDDMRHAVASFGNRNQGELDRDKKRRREPAPPAPTPLTPEQQRTRSEVSSFL